MTQETILKICDAQLTLDELKAIDLEEIAKASKAVPFEKRYSLSYILNMLDRCICGETSLDYLHSWAELYVEIIDGNDFEAKSLKEYFIDEISTCVDTLSVYDEEEEFYALEEYKTVFKELDEMLMESDSLSAVYNDDYDENQGFTLVVNDKKGEVTLIYTDPDLDYDFKRIRRAELISSISFYQSKGFKLTLIGMNTDFLTEISHEV